MTATFARLGPPGVIRRVFHATVDLPTTASGSDLLVIMCGKLHDNNHDPSNVQVVGTKTEGGEELSLQDMDGVFLRVPVLK